MKKLIGFILVTISLNLYGQSLEDKYLEPIIEDLIEYDGMKYEFNKKDSIITVYKVENNKQKEAIRKFKLNEVEYEKVISNFKEVVDIDKRREEAFKKEIKNQKTQKIIAMIATGVVILIVLL